LPVKTGKLILTIDHPDLTLLKSRSPHAIGQHAK